jgi:hypothetical protein
MSTEFSDCVKTITLFCICYSSSGFSWLILWSFNNTVLATKFIRCRISREGFDEIWAWGNDSGPINIFSGILVEILTKIIKISFKIVYNPAKIQTLYQWIWTLKHWRYINLLGCSSWEKFFSHRILSQLSRVPNCWTKSTLHSPLAEFKAKWDTFKITWATLSYPCHAFGSVAYMRCVHHVTCLSSAINFICLQTRRFHKDEILNIWSYGEEYRH